ncbi:hypothetical protein HK27_11065 [Acetobacter orientalis]|nr:hypothetical protein HK27_11065 [Acetobacter orientalis]
MPLEGTRKGATSGGTKGHLFLLAADVAVNFCAQRNFGNLWCCPSHDVLLLTLVATMIQEVGRFRLSPASVPEFV